MKIGLYGGSFDPPHLGHMKLAEDFYNDSGVDLLIVMPSFIPPHKISSGTPADDRLEMTKLSCLSLGEKGINYTVSSYEIEKCDTSYTIDTVEYLLERYSCGKISLCIGSDMLLCFEKWKCAELLLQKCMIYTEERAFGEYETLLKYAEYLQKQYGADIHIMKKRPFEVSSTGIRHNLGEKSAEATEKLLCPAVHSYIEKKHLYGTN